MSAAEGGIGERVERVYMILEREEAPRGAQAWFGRRVEDRTGTAPARSTIHRYCTGDQDAPDWVVGVLEDLEARARERLENLLDALPS